jgi:hypothetical protein
MICFSSAAAAAILFSTDVPVCSMTPLERAIHQVETSGAITGDTPILGDWCPRRKIHLSRGPLQISRGAWKDCLERDPTIGGRYEDVDGLGYSLRIFRTYQSRYATPARVGTVTDEIKARIWNGGPNGHKKAATLGYWEKTKRWLP